MKITVSRKAHFNAAHKLYNQNLSNEENFEIFGKCSYENFHGHNYELIVKILGDINPKTGMVMDLSDLKKIIKTEVEDLLDHKNLATLPLKRTPPVSLSSQSSLDFPYR